MKVTVSKYLNVRVGAPSVNAPCFQYLAPGSVIEVEDTLVVGDSYNDINKWFKGLDGGYYWSGGILSEFPWWISDFGIDELWNYTKGEGACVILLDSGLAECADITIDRIKLKTSVLDNDDGTDKFGHGTLMSSIVCGNGSFIKGIAPNCSIISIKIANSKDLLNANFIKGLDRIDRIISETPNIRFIVNCSLALKGLLDSEKASIISRIKSLSDKNVIFSVAAGNDYLKYPTFLESQSEFTISSAGITKNNQTGLYYRLFDSNVWPDVSVTPPGTFPSSQLLPKSVSGSGSSHACAYNSGLMAILVSLKPNIKINEIKSLYQQLITTTSDPNDSQIQNKIIDKQKLLQAIKNINV